MDRSPVTAKAARRIVAIRVSPSTIGAPFWPKLSWLLLCPALLGSAALGQEVKNYKPGQPVPCPTGYPGDLVVIPAGAVKIGMPAKEIREVAKEYGLGDAEREGHGMKLAVRELGASEQILDEFMIGRTEVTNEQYAAYVKANTPKVRFPRDWWLADDERQHREAFFKGNEDKRGDFKPDDYWRQNYKDLKWALPAGQERFPVTWVSWREAQDYCAWAGLRLPTEAEWQRACLQDKSQRYLWGKKWEPDALKLIDYETPRNRRKRPVGSIPGAASMFGVDDMVGNVWEWTSSFFLEHENYKNEWKALQSLLKSDKTPLPPEPLPDAAKRISKGGSFLSSTQGVLALRPAARNALGTEQTVEDLGFRVAKSMQPALDSTTIRYRMDFNATALGEATLDLPTAAELRRAGTGKSRTFEQRGIERWELEGQDKIRSYHYVSVVPVTDLKFREEEAMAKHSSSKVVGGLHGLPIFAVFSTEPLRGQQGPGKFVNLDPGIYVVSYRAAGLPDELLTAIKIGSAVLKLHRGKRPDPGAVPDDKKKDEKKKDDKKKKDGDKKEGEEGAEDPAQQGKWMEIVDRYGVTDEITMKFPQVQPDEIVLQPGGLKIPNKKNILLFRKHDGDYAAWSEYMPAVTRALADRSNPELRITEGTSKIEYVGGPRTMVSNYRFVFHLELRLVDGEFNKVWITPDTNKDVAGVKPPKSSPILAAPKQGDGGKQEDALKK